MRARHMNRSAARFVPLWLELRSYDAQPLGKSLSGLPLEYRIIQLYSRDAGRREAKIAFNAGQGTQDLGFRNEVDTLFTCLPARTIKLRVRDENDQPTTAGFIIRDAQRRIYPSQAKRLAPDVRNRIQRDLTVERGRRVPAPFRDQRVRRFMACRGKKKDDIGNKS